MAVEARRGCGYRQVGGLYLVCSPFIFKCDRGEIPLEICPVCSQGIKQSRGWTWIKPFELFGIHKTGFYWPPFSKLIKGRDCPDVPLGCNLCDPPKGKHGLLWIGAKFYSPGSFLKEAEAMGISKRIGAVPPDFKVGETVVYLAHPKGVCLGDESARAFGVEPVYLPGIIAAFMPQAIEKIVTEEQFKDNEAMAKLRNKGINPIVVPDEDLDHNPNYVAPKVKDPCLDLPGDVRYLAKGEEIGPVESAEPLVTFPGFPLLQGLPETSFPDEPVIHPDKLPQPTGRFVSAGTVDFNLDESKEDERKADDQNNRGVQEDGKGEDPENQ